VVVTFRNDVMTFRCTAGPFTGSTGGTDPYRARQVSDAQYLVNQHESVTRDLVTLLIDLDNMRVCGSALLAAANSVIFYEADLRRSGNERQLRIWTPPV
jgi:hypothetical protein